MPGYAHRDVTLTPAARALVEALIAPPGEAWGGPVGDLLIEDRDGGGGEVRVRFRGDGVSIDETPAPPSYDGPVTRIAASAADLAGLADGSEDGALLYLGARLDVAGDTDFLLALAPHLRVPGTSSAFIDPQALEPEAVAAAIKDVPTEHLAVVMAGGFRDLVLGEVFRRLPEFLDAAKAANARVAVAFVVGGRADGQADRYLVRVDRGTCTVLADQAAEHPADVSLLLDGPQFLRLVLGQINPVRAVLGGQVRVQGELIKALGFNSVMRIPGI